MNQTNKKITLFAACYNQKKYIKDAVESLATQDYPNRQVVIVDDCSDDGSYELLAPLQKKWDFVLLRTDKPRRGIYWISNMIMKEFSTPYYQILGGDDILLPGVTRKLLAFMEREGAEIVGGQLDCIDEKGNDIPGDNRWRPYNANYAFEIKRDSYVNHPGMLWRCTVIDKIGYFNDSTICTSDFEFLIKALKNNIVIRNLQDSILKYRVHANSLSNAHRFGKVNIERENNRKRIDALYPDFYHIEFRFLDFFIREMEFAARSKREVIERWCLRYIVSLIGDKKIEDYNFVFSLLEEIRTLKNEVRDIRILLYYSKGEKEKAMRLFYEKPHTGGGVWSYRVASIYKTLGAWEFSKKIFEGLSAQPELEVGLKSGIHFHLGEIALWQGDSWKALSAFKMCLSLNPQHIKSREYYQRLLDVPGRIRNL